MNFNTTIKVALGLLSAFLLMLCISSCKKINSEPPPAISGLAVIQASPNLGLYDFYVGSTKANFSDFTYNNQMSYLNIYSGDRKFTLTKKNEFAALKSATITLKAQLGYTLFFLNKAEQLEYMLLEDNLTRPAANKVSIRFVNTSWNAPALDLIIEGTATHTFTNKAFKAFSNFEVVNSENVTLKLKNTLTGEVMATYGNVALKSGKIYTIYARGDISLITTDTLSLSIALFEHT